MIAAKPVGAVRLASTARRFFLWLVASPVRRTWLVAVVAMAVCAIPTHLASTPYNNYVLFADALRHGRLWIDWPGPYIDAVAFANHRYIVNDPVPGILLLPYVWFAGTSANQTVLAVLLAGLATGAAWLLVERLHVPRGRGLLLAAFFFAGTDLWWTAVFGDVWFLAQTSAVAFTTLALAELARDRPRGWWVGTAYALAVGSRFTMIMALPVMAYLLYRGKLGREWSALEGRKARLISFAVVIGAFGALWVAYNYARWGVPWDSGHTVFYHQDSYGSMYGSPFDLRRLPGEISSFFFAAPTLLDHSPWIVPEISGTALTWTSPALLFAFFATKPVSRVRALWLATALVALPSFLYYVNGTAQYGMRHALDFEPFLYVLMLFAAREQFPRWVVLTSAYSIVASAYGVYFWIYYVRGGHF